MFGSSSGAGAGPGAGAGSNGGKSAGYVHAASAPPYDKLEYTDNDAAHHRGGNWRKWALGALAVIIIIGLAVGLGVGLGLKNNHGSGSGSGSGTAPAPCSNCTNGTNPTPIPGTLVAQTAWQIVLSETLVIDNKTDLSAETPAITPNNIDSPKVSLFDIDMFLHQNNSVVPDLQAMNITVICYFSAGSYEPYRPDSWKFKKSDMGKELDGWPGEYWLDLNSENVRSIMSGRIETAAEIGCDGIDPDNVDGYDNDNGLGLTEDDSVDYMQFLGQEAADHNLMIGLKNAGAIVDRVIDFVHFSVNEECVNYDECDTYSAFPQNGKPVFHIEYPAGDAEDTHVNSFATGTVNKYCNTGYDGEGFNTVLKFMNLSGWVQYCDNDVYLTQGQ